MWRILLVSLGHVGRHGLRMTATVLPATAVAVAVVLVLPSAVADAAPVSLDLGTATGFGVLAGAGIANTGSTTVTGDIGTYPTTSVTGAAGLTVHGTDQGGDAVTQGAQADFVSAYAAADGEGPPTPIAAALGTETLAPGVYGSRSSLKLAGVLTLDGGGDADAVFVFRPGSTLATASDSRVALVDGTQSCHVFWLVGSSAKLGTDSSFRGTVMALAGIRVATGTSVDGRLLAPHGTVTLDADTVTTPTCTTPATTTTTTTTTSPAPATGRPESGQAVRSQAASQTTEVTVASTTPPSSPTGATESGHHSTTTTPDPAVGGSATASGSAAEGLATKESTGRLASASVGFYPVWSFVAGGSTLSVGVLLIGLLRGRRRQPIP